MSFFRKSWQLMAALIVLALLFAIKSFVPMYVIGSGSMEPTLPVGSVVILGSVDSLKPTDIITYQKPGDSRPTTHTFIGYDEKGNIRTKGDANAQPDVHIPALTQADVLGKVVMATPPLLSREFWLSTKGAAIILLLIGGFFLLSGDTDKTQSTPRQKRTTPV